MRIHAEGDAFVAAAKAIKPSAILSAHYTMIDAHERSWTESHTPAGSVKELTETKTAKVEASIEALCVLTLGGEAFFDRPGVSEEKLKECFPDAVRVTTLG